MRRRLPAPRAAEEVRLLLVADARPGAVLHVDRADHHYLVRVLRLGPGAVIPVADAAGRRTRATVMDVTRDRVRLLVDAERGAQAAHATAPAPGAVVLVQALPRGALMDRVVRQATELGAIRIVPVVADRTQGRADPAAQERRRQRWQRIARQAAQQSGSAPPPIDPPVSVRRYLERAPAHGLGLLFRPGAALLHAGAFHAPGALDAPGALPLAAGAAGAAGAAASGSRVPGAA
ncbi:MAG: RsmE family RNA methyltransferase, partial [Spirochaetaceae bacterium]|nr:RsmE family RNA methyltransferase [Spirochaetaceae bacterium]